MYNVVTGPFHPSLESTFAQEIRQLKSTDPYAPIAVVVPSELLRRRLQWLLCVEHQCSLFDVHFLTFHQLALHLYQERLLFNQGEGVLNFKLVHDFFFEHLLHSLTKEYPLGLERLTGTGLTAGTCKGLWSTIRDLKEAMVDPKIVLQGVQEGLFGEDEREKLQNLFSLYSLVQETSQALHIGSADDLTTMMIPWVQHSTFLSRVNRVCYYGFYDLSQVQLSLFETIAAKAQVTVYFPLDDDPAFTFARQFFERHLCSGGQSHRREEESFAEMTTRTGNENSPRVMVMSTVGAEDELSVVCKEIINLVENHQYRFDEIGIVARSLEPYQPSLRRTFDQHQIPFTSSAMVPVIQEPLIKHLIQFSRLLETNFYWRDMLDVFASPYYRFDRLGVVRDDIRPEFWHLAVRTLGIHRGQDQWQRLRSLSKVGSSQGRDHELPKFEKDRVAVDPEHLQLLDRLVSELIADNLALPAQGTIGELTQAFLTLAKKHMALPGLMDVPGTALHDLPNQSVLAESINQALTILHEMHLVKETMMWEQWAQLFHRVLKICTMAIEPDLHAGVRVLDAMSARGLPFRAVFLMGLNENVFPRYIREDAFLRDRSRRVLEETFGYKIDEKLAAYDEERLLFALLARAAHQRFYLMYQRANKEGRPLASSSYLTEYLSSDPAVNPTPEISVPRRLSDRFAHPLFAPNGLTREELGLQLICQGYDPTHLLAKEGREPQLFQNGWAALKKMEQHGRQVGEYDGLIRTADRYWQEYVQKGVTPTSLELYARCPFQFFVKRVLQVSSVRVAMLEELPASSLGELCHAVLHLTYRHLRERGWPEQAMAEVSLNQNIIKVAEDVLSKYAADHATGYSLTWEIMKDSMIQLVTSVVEADQQAYLEHGFRPMAFEVNAEGQFAIPGSSSAPIKIRGRLDRIDVRNDPPGIRIVDYKFQTGSRMRSPERDLLLSGIRGFHLQPPIYGLMSEFHDQQLNREVALQGIRPEGVDFVYLAPRWDAKIVRSAFDAASWQSASGGQLTHTVRTLLQGIQSGRYFILPGDYCRHCEVSTACRRFHGPTWWRSYGALPARTLRQLRTQVKQGD